MHCTGSWALVTTEGLPASRGPRALSARLSSAPGGTPRHFECRENAVLDSYFPEATELIGNRAGVWLRVVCIPKPTPFRRERGSTILSLWELEREMMCLPLPSGGCRSKSLPLDCDFPFVLLHGETHTWSYTVNHKIKLQALQASLSLQVQRCSNQPNVFFVRNHE